MNLRSYIPMKKHIVLFILFFNISLSSQPSFDSVYSDFSKDCSYENREVQEGEDAPLVCKPKFGYTAMITYSACMEFRGSKNDDSYGIGILVK